MCQTEPCRSSDIPGAFPSPDGSPRLPDLAWKPKCGQDRLEAMGGLRVGTTVFSRVLDTGNGTSMHPVMLESQPLLPAPTLRAPAQGFSRGRGLCPEGSGCSKPPFVSPSLVLQAPYLHCAPTGCWAARPSSPWLTSSCGSCPPSPACEYFGTRPSTAYSRPWQR